MSLDDPAGPKSGFEQELEKLDENVAEIDLSSSVIELVLHRPDGTLQRKKYRNEIYQNHSNLAYTPTR